jgi:hypothetical protein
MASEALLNLQVVAAEKRAYFCRLKFVDTPAYIDKMQ